ncbi:hypothetical protein [Halalkalibacter urbisdiaboli]|uniref:hypothetical protein n=1 Tax=Halalkalibacter urbisdiaboli TaxID=1960589 RepID=UPI0010562C46|nr:hypothetical protein [Halalkalibacter urbisdiaboli]
MMRERNVCKGCTGNVSTMNSEPIIYDSDPSLDENIVEEEQYKRRLNQCLACSSLQNGTTCIHSGALVAFRARFRDKDCPFPGKSKW